MQQTVQIGMPPDGWVNSLGTFWCKHFHASVMWPIHGQYECRSCGRRHSVPWDPRDEMPARRPRELSFYNRRFGL
jgi:hypothetical protein